MGWIIAVLLIIAIISFIISSSDPTSISDESILRNWGYAFIGIILWIIGVILPIIVFLAIIKFYIF